MKIKSTLLTMALWDMFHDLLCLPYLSPISSSLPIHPMLQFPWIPAFLHSMLVHGSGFWICTIWNILTWNHLPSPIIYPGLVQKIFFVLWMFSLLSHVLANLSHPYLHNCPASFHILPLHWPNCTLVLNFCFLCQSSYLWHLGQKLVSFLFVSSIVTFTKCWNVYW